MDPPFYTFSEQLTNQCHSNNTLGGSHKKEPLAKITPKVSGEVKIHLGLLERIQRNSPSFHVKVSYMFLRIKLPKFVKVASILPVTETNATFFKIKNMPVYSSNVGKYFHLSSILSIQFSCYSYRVKARRTSVLHFALHDS